MFRRLRERIAEEATKFPVGQLANNPAKLFPENDSKSSEANSTEDLITLSENSSVIVPHTSSQQFSIGEDDDGSFSEQSTPQKSTQNKQVDTPESLKNAKGHQSTPDNYGLEYRPHKRSSYIPQSDIESEREEPPTLNLDSISKEQLLAIIQTLKAKSYKYKNKYAEVVKNFKELREEKIKVENTLTEHQDKALRRIAELREQCLLEQKAKAHLEENLRLLLEEKDSRISVLKTQINLLKEGKLDSSKSLLDDCDIPNSDIGSYDTKSEDSITSFNSDVSVLQEQMERLKHQINQDKKTITAQKDQISLLRKQNENLSEELEIKVKKLNELEDDQEKLRSEHESVLKSMQSRLEELEKQQEESVMSMAETKKNMHEELELKEKQLVKSEEEVKHYQSLIEQERESISETKKQHEEKVNELLRQLELTEKTLEEEKESLLQELAQGKAAAVQLMQKECAKKVAAVEEEWKSKLQEVQSSYEKNSNSQVKELSESLKHSNEKVKESEKKIQELRSTISKIEKENVSLKNSIEKLESEFAICSENYEKLKNRYKDYGSLKLKEGQLVEQQQSIISLNREIDEREKVASELKTVMTGIINDQEKSIDSLDNENKVLTAQIDSHKVSKTVLKNTVEALKEEILILHAHSQEQSDKAIYEQSLQEKLVTDLSKDKESQLRENTALQEQHESHLEDDKQLIALLNENIEKYKETELELRNLTSSLYAEISEQKLSIDSFENDKKVLATQISNLESEKKNLTTQLELYDASKIDLENTIKVLENKISCLEKEKSNLTSQIESYNMTKIELENTVGVLNNKISCLEKEKANLISQIESYEMSKTDLENTVGVLNNKILCLEKEKTNLTSQIESNEVSKTDLESTVGVLTNKISNLENEKNILSAQIESYEVSKTDLENTVGVLNIKISNLENEKNTLSTQIESYEVSKRDLETALKTSKNEMLAKLKDQSDLIEKLNLENSLKDQQVKDLSRAVEELKFCEKSASEEISEANVVYKNLEAENVKLLSNNKCLVKQIECMKHSLIKSKNEITSLNAIISKAENEINLLNEVLPSKEEAVEQIKLIYKKTENHLKMLEKQEDSIKLAVDDLENVCKVVSSKVDNIHESFILKKDSFKAVSTQTCLESSSAVAVENFEDSENSDFQNGTEVRSELSLLQEENSKLKEELHECRNSLEIQNIEFAKYITELQHSLDELQEERNNLSLVLQSVENAEAIKKAAAPSDRMAQDVDKESLEKKISALNLKVKSEIETVTTQARIIDQELKNLREQFKSSQDVYTEKIMELNSKLLFRTERLLNIKEEFDIYFQHTEKVKATLDETKSELKGKAKALKSSENSRKELENEIKSLKEKSYKKECELKEIHNCQLNDLKNQTKQTLEKLHEQISSLNSILKQKDDEFNTKLICMQHQYNEQILSYQDQSKEILFLKNILDNLENTRNCFENKIGTFVLQFDSYCSRIRDLNCKISKFSAQLKEKDNIIADKSKALSDLENQFRDYNILREEQDKLLEKLDSETKEKSEIIEAKNDIVSSLENQIKDNAILYEEHEKLQKEFSSQIKEKDEIIKDKTAAVLDLEKQMKDYAVLQENFNKLQTEFDFQLREKDAIIDDKNKVILKIENQIKDHTVFQEEHNKLKVEFESVKTVLTECNIELQTEKNKLSELQNTYSDKVTLLKEKDNELNNMEIKLSDTEHHIQSLADELKTAKEELEKMNTTVHDLKENCGKLTEEFNKKCESEKRMKETLESFQKAEACERSVSEKHMKEILESLHNKETELNDTKIKLEDVYKDVDNLSAACSTLQQKLTETDEMHKNASTILNQQLNRNTELEKENSEWSEKHKDLMSQLKLLQSELQLKNEKFTSTIELELYNNLCSKYEKETNEYKNEISDLLFKIESLSSSLSEKSKVVESNEIYVKNVETRHEESIKCMKGKLQSAEENYKIQINEMKQKLVNLEKERNSIKAENESLKQFENKYNELKKAEEKIRKELQSKESELESIKAKTEVSNKEQSEKMHSLQENMKDKENMVLKLKASIESITKENSQKCEELSRKIKRLEEEREQLMLQAQERVSTTELKYREEVKCLEEKCNKLLSENSEMEKLKNHINCLNKQLDESLVLAQSNQAASNKEILALKEQLNKAEKKMSEAETSKKNSESLLLSELEKLQQDKDLLLQKSNHLEKLKSEKEELNEKLKNMAQQVNKISELEAETQHLKKENDKLIKENKHLNSLEEKCKLLEKSEASLKEENLSLTAENKKFSLEINNLATEKSSLLKENSKLLDHIKELEMCNTSPENPSTKSYIDLLKKQYEDAIKAKDNDVVVKLKELVRDFSKQMEIKDRDSEQMISELIEKNQHLEETLRKEHQTEIADLRQDLFEKNCALSEMRDSYEEALQEKEIKLKELEATLRSLQKDNSSVSETFQNAAESSDWDDTWAVPDEVVENSSPVHKTNVCDEHLLQIESLQEELSKCNSEIKEFKLLLRLSPPEDVDNNKNRRDSMQSLPEPTEFEYLKNIVYEYMMGKEPVTLAKVIAAVLKFSDSQTQQIIKREEAKHPPK